MAEITPFAFSPSRAEESPQEPAAELVAAIAQLIERLSAGDSRVVEAASAGSEDPQRVDAVQTLLEQLVTAAAEQLAVLERISERLESLSGRQAEAQPAVWGE